MAKKIKSPTIRRICKAAFMIALFVIVSLVLFLLVSKAYYRDYYANSFREFEVPGLNDNFVPQGLEYIVEYDAFLISGYLSNTGETRIYVVKKNDSYREIGVKSADGSCLKSHAGGISSCGEYVYIAGCDGYVYVLSSKEIMREKTKSATIIGSFQTDNNATFTAIDDGYLFVGEFYHGLKYATSETHHITTLAGEENKAMMFAFELNGSKSLGIEPEASRAFSITGRIQGMCVSDDNRLILSASSIFAGSQLYVYDLQSVLEKTSGSFTVDNKDIPLYYLDGTNLIDEKQILPKAEGIVYKDGRIYILYESAANRFAYGKLLGAQYLYSIESH